MKERIQLLDCTLRDGAYIVESKFGESAMKGIIKKLQDANVDIIECGWLKDKPHVFGTSYFHVPSDFEQYLVDRKQDATYSVMIDWDRYNLDVLPVCDHKSIDAIRVVFPHGKHEGGVAVAKQIKEKGYDVYLQAANTLAYSEEDLIALAKCVNTLEPKGLSIVDTFGAMYTEDVERIMTTLDKYLLPSIALGMHTHNNQQLAFSHVTHFIDGMMKNSQRKIIVDSSLCGMGRGAGNATTELVVSYLDRKYNCNYDLNAVLDAIDMYMGYFKANYEWGYNTYYFVAGVYCSHVNNIAYLLNNHSTNARDMRNIIESMDPKDRRAYDYDLLESKYVENQNRIVDDEATIDELKKEFKDRKVLLVAPGKSILTDKVNIDEFIEHDKPVVIAVNAISKLYNYDFAFFSNPNRYDYAKDTRGKELKKTRKILLSNIKTVADKDEYVINFNKAIKRGWPHFDNAVICALRILNKLGVKEVYLAGFDGFKNAYNESYAENTLPSLNPGNDWDGLNKEVTEMFVDLRRSLEGEMNITFITESIFDKK